MGIILEYLNKRKEKWLKDKIKTKMSEIEIAELKKKAEEKFSIQKWIPDAAKRAKQLSLATHVCKYTHPDAKTSSIIYKGNFANDGYVHSGNVTYEMDAFGNAAVADVFDFLLSSMDDGRTILEHFENDSDEIHCELNFFKEEYKILKEDFLAIKKGNQDYKSDERVKQVYFPISEKYHLLSILTAPGILSVLRDRITDMKERKKTFKEKKDEKYGGQFDDVFDLTEIAFGGANPINIGILNSRRNGKAYLLSSRPPTILKKDVIRPRYDFFNNTLRIRNFQEDFKYLHTLFVSDKNNMEMRNKIRTVLQVIIDKVMSKVYQLREIKEYCSWAESHSQLPMAQKIWLDDHYVELREKNDEWLDEISISFARWIIRTYENILKNNRIMLGDGEAMFLRNQVEAVLLQDKGFFR